MINNYYIYAHYTKETNELFYIGKGSKNRAHSDRGRSKYWSRIVEKYGIKVVIIVEELTNEEANKLEIMAISLHSPRCNFTKGGAEGHTTEKYNNQQLKSFKKKCSESKKNWWKSKDDDFRKKYTKPARKAVSKMWQTMDKVEKSKEQKRRNSLKPRKKVKCINNGKIYNNVTEAAEKLNIKYKQGIYNQINGYKKHINGYKFTYIL